MQKTGELIKVRFALANPATGVRLTSGATFTVLASDPNNTDISSQISVTSQGNGFYYYSFTPQLEGMYVVSLLETTTQQYINDSFKVGGVIEDHIMNLGNNGETVTLGSGGGPIVYNGNITKNNVAQGSITVRAFTAQDAAVGGADGNAVVDIQTVVATATTDSLGNFTMSLSVGYYALQYIITNLTYQTYIRWSSSRNNWVVSTTPISTSQL